MSEIKIEVKKPQTTQGYRIDVETQTKFREICKKKGLKPSSVVSAIVKQIVEGKIKI